MAVCQCNCKAGTDFWKGLKNRGLRCFSSSLLKMQTSGPSRITQDGWCNNNLPLLYHTIGEVDLVSSTALKNVHKDKPLPSLSRRQASHWSRYSKAGSHDSPFIHLRNCSPDCNIQFLLAAQNHVHRCNKNYVTDESRAHLHLGYTISFTYFCIKYYILAL